MSGENVRVHRDCEKDFGSGDGDLDRGRNRPLVIFFGGVGFQFARVVVAVFRAVRGEDVAARHDHAGTAPRLQRTEGERTRSPRESLCHSCSLAHIVRGYERDEEVMMCGHAFPPRAVLFAVRECTDHKLKRERSGAEIAGEGAVSYPPLGVKAADFCAAVAAREACGE